VDANNKMKAGVYIDLFSGCGGLSLGLGCAGWQGLFAVEKDPMAFSTLKHNMIDGKYAHFNWPKWLPQKSTTIQELLKQYPAELSGLNGKVDLIAGGPPCQGFSLAGMRNSKDPRNKLSHEYIKMVDIIRPKYLLLENVRGFSAAFSNGKGESKKKPHSEIVKAAIEKLGYRVFTSLVNCQEFGVPQQRTRFIMMGVRNDLPLGNMEPFELLNEIRLPFLKDKGLPLRPVTVKEAICDLETTRTECSLIEYSGESPKGFKQLAYIPPKNLTDFQILMRKGLNGSQPNSMRLARHKASTCEKFKLIHEICRPGYVLNSHEREKIGTRKQAICVLDPQRPSKTLTTLPDDLLHYKEPRILTVRESARIQSFPDDFDFKGKYTTGGKERTKECPRYTQVGNAVPPLLGEALGELLTRIASRNKALSHREESTDAN